MLTLTPVVLQLVELGIEVAPSIISAAQQEITLFNGNTSPTADQQTMMDAALDAAHAALQTAQSGALPAV